MRNFLETLEDNAMAAVAIALALFIAFICVTSSLDASRRSACLQKRADACMTVDATNILLCDPEEIRKTCR